MQRTDGWVDLGEILVSASLLRTIYERHIRLNESSEICLISKNMFLCIYFSDFWKMNWIVDSPSSAFQSPSVNLTFACNGNNCPLTKAKMTKNWISTKTGGRGYRSCSHEVSGLPEYAWSMANTKQW